MRKVERRGGVSSAIGPRASWWWAYKPSKKWMEEEEGTAIAHLELCGWCPEKRESVWAGSLPGIREVAEKNRCRHSRGEHGRAPGAESGKVPFPRPLYQEQVALLESWYSTGRALPEKSKPRAWPRTPWEAAFGELVEVVQFKKLLKWKDKSGVHINRLELRGRNKVVRRFSRRPKKHHRRIVTTGDSRVMTGCAAKGRSPGTA